MGVGLCERHWAEWCRLRDQEIAAVDIAVNHCPDLKQYEIRHLERMSQEPVTT
jgi:hypothetical protein